MIKPPCVIFNKYNMTQSDYNVKGNVFDHINQNKINPQIFYQEQCKELELTWQWD